HRPPELHLLHQRRGQIPPDRRPDQTAATGGLDRGRHGLRAGASAETGPGDGHGDPHRRVAPLPRRLRPDRGGGQEGIGHGRGAEPPAGGGRSAAEARPVRGTAGSPGHSRPAFARTGSNNVRPFLLTLAAVAAVLAFANNARCAEDAPAKRAKELAEALKKKDYAAATTHFGGELKKKLDKDALADLWKKVIDKFGDMKKIGESRTDDKD